ncbi:OadG family transporter subunit [Gemmiger formicilis]|nr:OadG family transporter subunit [Gemmiger formicilis]
MPNLALLALEASDGTVVLTSITLVFAMLVALCLIITLEGKIFDNINNKKNGKPAAPKAPAAKAAPAPLPSPPPLRPRLTTAPSPARSSPRSPLPWPRSAAAMPSFAASSAFQACRRFPPRCLGRRRCA